MMSEDNRSTDSRMDSSPIERRILAASDDLPRIHAIAKTGEAEGIDYYLVVARKSYTDDDGTTRPMLKVRHFAANKADPQEDTWMTNGLTTRYSDELAAFLGKALLAVSNDHDPANTVEKDLSEYQP